MLTHLSHVLADDHEAVHNKLKCGASKRFVCYVKEKQVALKNMFGLLNQNSTFHSNDYSACVLKKYLVFFNVYPTMVQLRDCDAVWAMKGDIPCIIFNTSVLLTVFLFSEMTKYCARTLPGKLPLRSFSLRMCIIYSRQYRRYG